jgi:hypothetical protein
MVTVRNGSETHHCVRVSRADLARLAPGASDPVDLVEASFAFLLERESKESILRDFDLTVIGRYDFVGGRCLPSPHLVDNPLAFRPHDPHHPRTGWRWRDRSRGVPRHGVPMFGRPTRAACQWRDRPRPEGVMLMVRRLMKRFGVAVSVAAVVLSLSASAALAGEVKGPPGTMGPALAASPRVQQGTFTFPVDEFDSGLCGFPIHIQSQASGSFTILFDAAGNPEQMLVQFAIADGTFSANGVSLRQGSSHNTTIFSYDGSGNLATIATVGVTTQIFLPHGVVIEAGRVVENVVTGDVTFVGKALTPEDGQALCGALGG